MEAYLMVSSKKSWRSKNRLCCKHVSVEAAEGSYPLSQVRRKKLVMFSLKNLIKEKSSVAAVATRQVVSCWGGNTDIKFDKASLYEYTRE